MCKRILLWFVLTMLMATAASENGPLRLTGSVGESGDYALYDAAFLPTGELLLAGGWKSAWNADSGKPWLAKVNAQTGETLWTHTLEGFEHAFAFQAVTPYGDGFAACAEQYGLSYLVIADAQGEVGDPVELEAYVKDLVTFEENLIAVGYTSNDGAPWAAMLNARGDILWRYRGEPSGENPGTFTCAARTTDGILAGGGVPGHALLVKLDANGNELWEKQGDALGSIQEINDLAIDGDRIVLAGIRYTGELGNIAGVAATLTDGGAFIAETILDSTNIEGPTNWFNGVYASESGRGYTLYGSVCRRSGTDFHMENYTLLYLVGRDLNYRNEYHPPYGTNATVVKVLRDENGAVWVIGYGNGQGDAFRSDGAYTNVRRIFLARATPALLDTR